MQGLHLTADLQGCRSAALLGDVEALRRTALAAVARSGLSPVGELFHRFADGGGVTGVVLLAESHVALHTWPELAAVTLDVFVCNHSTDNSARASALMQMLEAAFAPERSERQRLDRARPGAGPAPPGRPQDRA